MEEPLHLYRQLFLRFGFTDFLNFIAKSELSDRAIKNGKLKIFEKIEHKSLKSVKMDSL